MPPRGTITSMNCVIASISLTAARSRVGTSWIASAGRPRATSPSTMQRCSAAEEWKLSDPPRRITAFPAFTQSAPASTVTLGRLS